MECRHPACTCQVQGDDFCSEACRNADPLVSGICECGHDGCGAVAMDDAPGVLPGEA